MFSRYFGVDLYDICRPIVSLRYARHIYVTYSWRNFNLETDTKLPTYWSLWELRSALI